jgi:cystathionine beta-lyase/cystathionine gamma-synthase
MKRVANKKLSWDKIHPHVLPIFQTSVYDYPDLDTIDDYYNGLIPNAYIYSRNGLPNSENLAKQVAKLENAEAGIVCSSGMAAISVLLLSKLNAGDQAVAASGLYGGTTMLLNVELARFGIKTTFVNPSDLRRVKKEVQSKKPKVLLVETISNPTMEVSEIDELSKIAHGNGSMLAVDNTFASPFVTKPIDRGADIVIHSGTKFLGGHSDLTIGILCGRSNDIHKMSQISTRFGTTAGPFDCWLATRSLSTWRVRMIASCANAAKLATYLETRKDKISRVYYPGLSSNTSHVVSKRIFSEGLYGGMLSFDIKGGLKSTKTFVSSLKGITLTPSLGGVRTTISHPGKTSHRNLGREERKRSGITDSMIRMSVGIEDYDQIEEEVADALRAVS